MKKIKVLVIFSLAIQIIFGSLVISASEIKKDITGHWAEETIQEWLDQGYINGYSDGSFKPNASITRAEFVKMVNRAYYIQSSESSTSQSSPFTDLPERHWAYQEIIAAAEAGYVSGTGDRKVSPNAVITRQEAAVMLVKLTNLEIKAELTFNDVEQIPAWSKRAIEAMVGGGIMEGDPSGNFRAKDRLTRAEAVVLIHKLLRGLESAYVLAGEYGSDQERTTVYSNVHIAAAIVTLVNTAVHGDLYIDEDVGEGDVFLKNVKVYGTTYVNGGGEQSIYLEGSMLDQIVVDKTPGKGRIVAAGSTTVEHVHVQSPVKLEESQLTGTGFINVELSSALPAGSEVELIGQFEHVQILADSIGVKFSRGIIDQLQVPEGATSNTINVSKDASIEKLVLDSVAKLIGEGTIKQAQLAPAAEQSTFETKPIRLLYVDTHGDLIVPEDAFRISKHSISSNYLQEGDVVEVKIPKKDNNLNREYTMNFIVERIGEGEGTILSSFSLDRYYDVEKPEGQVSFIPSNELGSIEVRLKREERIVYDARMEYDFTPATKLSGVIIRHYNDSERDHYYNIPNALSKDIVTEYDFSAIKDAVYISRPREYHSQFNNKPFEVTNQDMSYLTEIPLVKLADSKKYINGINYGRLDLGKYVFIRVFVYDSNKQFLGYVEYSGELSDEYVSDRINLIEYR